MDLGAWLWTKVSKLIGRYSSNAINDTWSTHCLHAMEPCLVLRPHALRQGSLTLGETLINRYRTGNVCTWGHFRNDLLVRTLHVALQNLLSSKYGIIWHTRNIDATPRAWYAQVLFLGFHPHAVGSFCQTRNSRDTFWPRAWRVPSADFLKEHESCI